MRKYILFDDYLKTRSGKRLPYYDEQTHDEEYAGELVDKSLHWFHEGYGTFQLYKIHDVDGVNYIAEPLRKFINKRDDDFEAFIHSPELYKVYIEETEGVRL